eukprot:PITA_10667
MKVISWNARGLNSQMKQRLLKKKVQKNKPDIIFVQETKCASSTIRNISKKLGKHMEYMETTSSGWEGGLVTLWDPQVIKVISSEATRSFIVVEAQMLRFPRAKAIIRGDFNMITNLMEKKGGIRRLNKYSEAFLDFINSANLVDVYPKSGAYTWNNKRGGERQIASRLDRFLISESILMEGVIVESDILPSGGSDHWLISLMAGIQGMPKNKPFRFEKFWLSHPDFIQLIEKWWNEPVGIRGTKMYKIQRKLRYIKDKIRIWNKTVFGNIFKEKANLEEQLEEIHKGWITGDINSETVNKEKMLMQQWQIRCQQEETLWKQKLRI